MYKKSFVLFILIFICSNLFAQEETGTVKRFFFGGGITFSPIITGGGHGEFALLLYHNGFDLRNHFVIRGNSISDNGIDYGTITLSEKISFGGISPNKLMRMYGFGEGGIGFFGNETKDLVKTPLAYVFGGGGGTDFFFMEKASIYFEAGWLGHLLDNKVCGSPIFQIGWRGYF
ncbi:MAG: hypothetical protein LBK00_02955 [Treponema sp.]|jgi:hypothetical protein|nr:hypothetical protein [Treponema sp.]